MIHLGTPYTYTYLPLYQAGAASAQRRAWVRGCPYTCTLSITQCQIVQNTHSTCFIKSKNADKTLLWVSFTTSGHYYSKFISWCFVLYDVSPPPRPTTMGASGPCCRHLVLLSFVKRRNKQDTYTCSLRDSVHWLIIPSKDCSVLTADSVMSDGDEATKVKQKTCVFHTWPS